MLVSVDGKISTGNSDVLDIDIDFPKIKGVREGLAQYYQLEKETNWFKLVSGCTMAKVGVNKRKSDVMKTELSTVVMASLIDGEPLHEPKDLIQLKALTLKKCDVLNNSYLHLQYDVINDTIVEGQQ